ADEVEAMKASYRAGGTGYGHYKQQLFEAMWTYFEPMRQRREALVADPAYVEGVLESGAQRARAKAREVLERVRQATGLGR
ncbi:MAG: tryptophan--tRNA ligase, partial [Verrucomicrobiae bacterium]|nr:tryptophan--tRNA ligase [Verrucomicrobiae bacterium]